jgi:hypothetical protein
MKPGPKKITPYSEEVERHIITTYNLLSEKDRRLYLAVEAIKLPKGGISYLSMLVNCSRTIIHDGLKELNEPELLPHSSIRKKGGGRKLAIETIPNINEVFHRVIEDSTAGDPMDGNIKWTNLSLKQISKRMANLGISVSTTVVKKLLKEHGFKKRKALKNETIGSCENRNEQFENINSIREEYLQSGNPIISMDSKKKNS